jgi:hypothetical protein
MTHIDSISRLEATLATLQSLTDRMKASSGIHQIDVDLLQQKTRELYEQILALVPYGPVEQKAPSLEKEESLSSPEDEDRMPSTSEEKIIEEEEVELEEARSEVIDPEPEPENAAYQQAEVEDIQKELPVEVMEEKPEPEEPVNDVEEEPVMETVENHEAVYEDVMIEKASDEPEPEEPVDTDPRTMLDLFSEAQDDSLATVLQKSNQPNLGEKLEHSRVGDLREGIGINDKFQFINELFNGDMDQYNKVLDELNSFSSRQGAMTYLSELSVQYDFSKTGMAFQKLKSLLDKKYA